MAVSGQLVAQVRHGDCATKWKRGFPDASAFLSTDPQIVLLVRKSRALRNKTPLRARASWPDVLIQTEHVCGIVLGLDRRQSSVLFGAKRIHDLIGTSVRVVVRVETRRSEWLEHVREFAYPANILLVFAGIRPHSDDDDRMTRIAMRNCGGF